MSIPRDPFKDHERPWRSDRLDVHLPPDCDLSETLRWILRQLHRRAASLVINQTEEPTALRLGEGEEPPDQFDGDYDDGEDDPVRIAEFERIVREELGESAGDYSVPQQTIEAEFPWQHWDAYFAGILATFRERGVDEQLLEGAEFYRHVARLDGPTDLKLQTEFYYAMQLIDMLPKIQQRSFELRTLPLLDHASKQLLDLLHEATRAHLLGLHTASLALCRAALEKALQDRVPATLVVAERNRLPGRGDLELLINAAQRAGLLEDDLASTAHRLRQHANGVLHGSKVVSDSAMAIGDTRLVIDRLFATT